MYVRMRTWVSGEDLHRGEWEREREGREKERDFVLHGVTVASWDVGIRCTRM
jgi:hypothetical protein